MEIFEKMSPFAALFNVDGNPEVGMKLLYGTILILSIIVFRLGFARKLPLLKNIVIYAFLALGCSFITILAVFLPVVEGLLVAAIILIIYKIRLKQSKAKESEA